MRSQSQRTERYATMSVASSVPSHIVPRTKIAPSGPVRSRNLLVIKQALMYDTRPVLTYKESIFFRLQESVANAEGKLNTAKASTRMINAKSDEIVKKSQKKFDFTNSADVKTRRFEQNMKAFEKLSTFINVRDVLQNMNTASTEKAKKGPKLPPLQILKEDETEYVVSPVVPNTVSGSVVRERPSFGFSTQRGFNVSSVEETISLKRLSKGQIIHRRAQSTKNSVIQVKEDDDLEEKVKRKDSYEMIMEKTTNFIADLNDADNRAVIFENNGKDLFYKELQDNILHKKFEVKKNNLFANEKNTEISEEQYYKGLLEFKEEAEAINKNYYDNYKAKTEKVLEMLKRASKDIFNRVSTRKKPITGGKNGKGVSEQEALEADIRGKWKQKLEQLLASEKFKGQYIEEELKHDLDAEFSEMMAKVNNIILIYQANQRRRDFVEEEEEEIDKSPKTERLMANRLNHEINKYHKNYMRNIIESAENHETILRKTKSGFTKKMRKIEDGFDKDILRIFPKDFESLRSDPGWASLYVDRPIRRNFSRKALNAINH